MIGSDPSIIPNAWAAGPCYADYSFPGLYLAWAGICDVGARLEWTIQLSYSVKDTAQHHIRLFVKNTHICWPVLLKYHSIEIYFEVNP